MTCENVGLQQHRQLQRCNSVTRARGATQGMLPTQLESAASGTATWQGSKRFAGLKGLT